MLYVANMFLKRVLQSRSGMGIFYAHMCEKLAGGGRCFLYLQSDKKKKQFKGKNTKR